ncbi:SLIT and NTRK-like protein 6 [Taenia crassiceps]|uniref:SLIT and NTRK-like protein 6 n=1 Tax=Taenia crassiceps TaxID=6207 RepID=A0ABR4QEH3_9CEST
MPSLQPPSFMKLLLSLFIFSIVSSHTGSIQGMPKKGCFHRQLILICKEEVPHGEDLQSPEIQTLVMSQLPEGTWLTLEEPQLASSGIQKIEVQRSFIDKVETGYFAKVGGKNKLKRLILRNVQGSAVVDKNMLQGLEKSLNYLVVTNGLTVNIADLTEMEKLADLELMDTKIVGTPADFEKLLPRLRSLNIRKCNLLQLPWEALAKWLTEGDSRRLKINDNEWICDCSMVKLKHLHPGVVESELQKLKCAGPPNLAGKQLFELSDEDLCPEGEMVAEQGGEKSSLEASSSTSGDSSARRDSGDNSGRADLGPSSGQQGKADQPGKSGAMRTEVIIGGTVVGVLVVAFIAFIIIYKCHIYPKNKNREERTSRTHQNKRYVNVIEEPPTRQYGNNSRVFTIAPFLDFPLPLPPLAFVLRFNPLFTTFRSVDYHPVCRHHHRQRRRLMRRAAEVLARRLTTQPPKCCPIDSNSD